MEDSCKCLCENCGATSDQCGTCGEHCGKPMTKACEHGKNPSECKVCSTGMKE